MTGWPAGVNQRLLRDGTEGDVPVRVLAEQTRCGVRKTRPALQGQPDTFSVKMCFTKSEFDIFETWYKNNILNGALPFTFPKIHGTGTGAYRFAPSSSYHWSNPSGQRWFVTMTWEEY